MISDTNQGYNIESKLQDLKRFLNRSLEKTNKQRQHSHTIFRNLSIVKDLVSLILEIYPNLSSEETVATAINQNFSQNITLLIDFINHYDNAASSEDEQSLAVKQLLTTTLDSIASALAHIPEDKLSTLSDLSQILKAQNHQVETIEQKLSDRLEKISPHLVTILQGALLSFNDVQNPLRMTNTATALRELLREIFEALAPDTEIKKCHWFTPDASAKSGVTRKHRVLFSIYSYIGNQPFPKQFSDEVERLASYIKEQIDKLSKFTHVTKERLNTPHFEATSGILSALQLYLLLMETIDASKEILIDNLSNILDNELSEIFFENLFDELDILSTHTQVRYVEYVEPVKIKNIDEKRIYFSGAGSVCCNLQYGSDGDLRRGDGMAMDISFPFSYEGIAQTKDIIKITVDMPKVDTDSFYG